MKLNVAVFFGGKSTEHEISCISANQVLKALDVDKYNIIPIYISKDNDFYTGEELLDLANYSSLDNLLKSLIKISFYKDGNKTYFKPLKTSLFNNNAKEVDVAFLVVHGLNIEDGSLAGYLEMLNLPYTSSDVLGSAIGQDKVIMKNILNNEGLDIVPWLYLYEEDLEDNEIYKKMKKLGYPLIAKPANLGSSIGIEILHNAKEAKEKLKECFKYDFKVVVEKLIEDLKEINISIMPIDGKYQTSIIEEVLKNDELLSFSDKYEKGQKGSKKIVESGSKGMASTSRKIPADISKRNEKKIKEMAIKAAKVLNTYGVIRIDFMINNKDDKVYINEINTIPGSLAFYLWDKEGIDFSKECDILINNAIKRYALKERKISSFNTNILSNFRRK